MVSERNVLLKSEKGKRDPPSRNIHHTAKSWRTEKSHISWIFYSLAETRARRNSGQDPKPRFALRFHLMEPTHRPRRITIDISVNRAADARWLERTFFSPPFGNKRTGKMISILREGQNEQRAERMNETERHRARERKKEKREILAVKIKCRIINATTRSAARASYFASSCHYYSYDVKNVSSRRNNEIHIYINVNVITRRNLRTPVSSREIPDASQRAHGETPRVVARRHGRGSTILQICESDASKRDGDRKRSE